MNLIEILSIGISQGFIDGGLLFYVIVTRLDSRTAWATITSFRSVTWWSAIANV